jgi:hypothetical protein
VHFKIVWFASFSSLFILFYENILEGFKPLTFSIVYFNWYLSERGSYVGILT